MNYKILYNYDTGDSVNQFPDRSGYVEIQWSNLEIAKENLKRIREHYNQYIELNNIWTKKTDDEILNENQKNDWFVKLVKKNNTIDRYIAEHSLILYGDDNTPFQFFAPWCGHFERLNYIEIIEDKSDWIITF